MIYIVAKNVRRNSEHSHITLMFQSTHRVVNSNAAVAKLVLLSARGGEHAAQK